jgi:hypothetical protein
MLSVLTGWALALLLGLRHAAEPDHLVAVSTLVTEQPSARRAAWQGAAWGVGHSAGLFLVAGLLVVLRLQLTAAIADLFELGVAVMLLGLGVRSLKRAFALRDPAHAHDHRGGATQPHAHGSKWQLARRPALIGVVHGLAGSGALTALVLAHMPSIGAALVYMLCFGVGSIVGMAGFSAAAGTPLGWLRERRAQLAALGALAGAMSLGLGLFYAWPIVSRFIAS